MRFGINEMRDLCISVLVLGFAFNLAFTSGSIYFLPATIFIVAVVFALHELGHKFTAQKFGCFAEYRMWPYGLVIALVFSFFGVIFAAPGAVYISCLHLTRRQNGLISLSGPAVNILLGFLFLLLSWVYAPLSAIFLLTARISVFLAFFNLIPFSPLDGSKIFAWDRNVWIIAVILSVLGLIII